VAFEGWNDAGEAASNAVQRLIDALGAEADVELDAEEYIDYQFSRPHVTTEDGRRRIVWPGAVFYVPEDPGSGIRLFLGTEPSRSWRRFADEVLHYAHTAGVDFVVLLGAMLADAPHTRPIATGATSEDAIVREAFGIERSSYEGPTGILGVLADAFHTAGIPSVSVWAQVPHYVHHAPSPKATLALLDRLTDFVPVAVPREQLAADAATWESGIDELAADDEDMTSYIETLERARDAADAPDATGDAIAEEFERYLRHRDGGAGSA
jgi:predicted ATP-grasp superfamily ATP-dependent carboligase